MKNILELLRGGDKEKYKLIFGVKNGKIKISFIAMEGEKQTDIYAFTDDEVQKFLNFLEEYGDLRQKLNLGSY